MPNLIPFSSILVEKVDEMLKTAQFHMTQLDAETVELVVYERQYSTGKQIIEFTGGENSQNHIRVLVTSGQPNIFLSTLKELLPNYKLLAGSKRSLWTYNDESELQTCIKEIADLIETRLFHWLAHPVFNPSKVPNPLTTQQLKERANTFKKTAEEFRRAGKFEEAKAHEQNFKAIEKKLKNDTKNS